MSQEKNGPFVTSVDTGLAKKISSDLHSKGFTLSKPEYTLFCGKKKGVSCTLYASGKLVVQGKDKQEFIEFYLEPEILGSFEHTYQSLDVDTTPHIGIDESGKGDFFGPLCIAGVYAGGDDILTLKKIGVKDSKNMSEAQIYKVGREIKKEFAHEIIRISPVKYNALYPKFKNLNSLLAWGHVTAIDRLSEKTGCHQALIDQFANERVVADSLARKNQKIKLEQRHRGEEDLVVAAASILARMTYLDELKRLSEHFELNLPKGASAQVKKAGKAFIAKHGRNALEKVAKLHFKTLESL